MSGLNHRFRVSSGKVTLPRDFAEQHGAEIVKAYKSVSDVLNTNGRYPMGRELLGAVKTLADMPYAGMALRLPFQDKYGRFCYFDNLSLREAAIQMVVGARMVVDPNHQQFLRDLRTELDRIPMIDSLPKKVILQGPGSVALRKMTLGV